MIFAFILLGFALLIGLISQVWLLVVAFREHILWGLATLLLPLAGLLFILLHWAEAKKPFFISVVALALGIGGFWMLNQVPPDQLGALAGVGQMTSGRFDLASVLVETPKGPTLEEQLASLRTREKELQARKAQLHPGDRAAAEALTTEILQYNAELQPVLAAIKARASAPQAPAPGDEK